MFDGLLVVVGQVVAVVAKLCSGAVVVKISFSVAKSISGIISSLWMLSFSLGSDAFGSDASVLCFSTSFSILCSLTHT